MEKVALDIETFDPNLSELGNGAIRGDGRILTVAMADETTEICFKWPEDKDKIANILSNKDVVKIAHNGVYDFDWLQNGAGLQIAGKMTDTMTRASLINEYAGHYDLDSCCLREGVKGKNKDESIDAWWAEQGHKTKAVKNLDKIPFDIVAKYNKQDARATYDLYEAQQKKIDSMNLREANELEDAQFPVILEMRKNGIRVDVAKIDALREDTERAVRAGMEELFNRYGLESLSKKKGKGTLPDVLKELECTTQMLKTPTGELSTAFNSLVRCPHPIAKQVIALKRKQTLLDKYLNSAFVKFCIGDRIHGTFKPTQRDDGGTVTGRYASSEPNMQNFSARESKGGDLVRSVFIPDEGCWLGKLDYSQIEYKLLAHFAIGPGSELLREQMKHGADYHQIVQDMLGWSGPDARKRVKVFNFGMLYGMGLNRFKENFELEAREAAAAMGMTTDKYTEHFYSEYIRRMTFLKPTTQGIQAVSQSQGFITSIGGRIHHVPTDGRLYKMPNYLIQGSAADINKMGLRDGWEAGVFNVLKLHLTVHDEAVVSVPMTKEGLEAVRELEQCMVNPVQLKIPILVEPGIGINWYMAGEKQGHQWYKDLCKEHGIAA